MGWIWSKNTSHCRNRNVVNESLVVTASSVHGKMAPYDRFCDKTYTKLAFSTGLHARFSFAIVAWYVTLIVLSTLVHWYTVEVKYLVG